jgi:hypothetical protein
VRAQQCQRMSAQGECGVLVVGDDVLAFGRREQARLRFARGQPGGERCGARRARSRLCPADRGRRSPPLALPPRWLPTRRTGTAPRSRGARGMLFVPGTWVCGAHSTPPLADGASRQSARTHSRREAPVIPCCCIICAIFQCHRNTWT